MFVTHKNEKVSGEKLEKAVKAVADDWRQLAKDIRKEDAYASHVTESQKDDILRESLHQADLLENFQLDLHLFYIWQDINYKLTGECVGLLEGL